MTNCSFQMKNDKNGWKKENYWKHPKKYFKQLSSACSTQKLFEINNNCTSFWFITKMSGILNIKDFHMKFVCSCWKIWKRTIPIADTKLSVIQMVSFFLLFKCYSFSGFQVSARSVGQTWRLRQHCNGQGSHRLPLCCS